MRLPLLGRSTSTNSTAGEANRPHDALDRETLGTNASIPFTTVQSSGPACRPLEFPAPILERAVTVSANIVDHSTGNIVRATNVLMRRAVHAKTCASQVTPAGRIAPFDSSTGRSHGHSRVVTPDSIPSWHSSSNASSISFPVPPQKQTQQQHSRKLQCCKSCDLPYRAYCVRRKICNTTYGSIRLCVVLKRVSRNVMNYASSLIPENGFDSDEGSAAVPEWETTSEMVAIKVTSWSQLQTLRGRHLEDPIKEVAALQLLGRRHPHVISILDALQNDTHLFCVFPYMPGALSTCLIDDMASSPTGRISEYQARMWFRQILCGISQLQKKGICHRDLCIDNMVVDENKNIHIIDLGLCLRVPFTDPNSRMRVTDVSANTCRRLMKAQGQCGLWQYMAPEARSRCEFLDGFATDLWSAGIVLFEFLVGIKPFALPDPADRNFKSISDEGNLERLVESTGAQLSDQAVDLLQNMLWHSPAKRLTLEEIVNHPWVQGSGEISVSSMEGDGLHSWLIKTESIDDLDDAKPSELLLAELQDSHHSESTSGTMNSSDDTMEVDAEDNCSQPHESPARNCSRRSSLQPPSDALDSIEEEDIDTRRQNEPKLSWGCCFPTKKLKWRRALKATTSLPLQSRNCEHELVGADELSVN
ncbi:hypothetical protein ACHAW5_003851 [Stephanodiscus triporus]|uniref:Protein kinase domain-containing protein n=1 Tax=Stephanodiscus triporus TaxID=2934178 RepID=A0ABD3NL72_9STRA